jgi:cyclopropane fatty-acyl-phospholipid synthase-like methyltransferase
VLEAIREHLDPGFAPRRVLDFGCGVGRLVVPFARRAEHVLGVDVSASMLAEAQKNCVAHGVENARFALSDDALSEVDGSFDLVHAYIVFQHIPVRRGMRLFERLLDHVAEGGVGALHFNFARSRKRRAVAFLKAVPLIHNVYNLTRGKPFTAPRMQMNAYDLNALFAILHRRGFRNVYASLRHRGGEVGAVLFFQSGTAARF